MNKNLLILFVSFIANYGEIIFFIKVFLQLYR